MRVKRTRTYIKRCSLSVVILFVMYSLFIYRLSLHKTENRLQGSYSLSEEDRHALVAITASTSDETEIIRSCCEFACKKLSFHRKNNLKNKEANCVGYAQYTTALLNSAFKYKGLLSKARPVVGQVHLYGLNLHPLAMAIMPTNLKSFFMNHNFVEIRKEKGDAIYIDTSLQDIIGKSFI